MHHQNIHNLGEIVEPKPTNLIEVAKSQVTSVREDAFMVIAASGLLTTLSSLTAPSVVAAKDPKVWDKVDLPAKETLFDITFDAKRPNHGWLIGAKGTFFETFDGGNNWIARKFTNLDEDEEITYRFEVADLNDDEGWILGKPAILLHTKDGGKQFERIPLPPKLPGDPVFIKSIGSNEAEMV